MKGSTIKYIYFVIVLIHSGLGHPYFRQPITMVYLFILTAAMFAYFRVKISPTLTKIVGVWFIYCLSFIFRFGEPMELFVLRHLTYILATYLFVYLYKHTFFVVYENTIYSLAIISLFFFTWEVIDFNSMHAVFSQLNLVKSSEVLGQSNSQNILIYTLHHRAIDYRSFRNCGFAWEPGPFSIFLALAIYINMLRTGVKIKNNYRFFIFVITLATTQSTTGFIAISLMFLEMVFLGQKGFKKYIVFIALGAVFIYLFFTLEFLSQKVFELYASGNAETIINNAKQSGNKGSLGRFAGFSIAWIDFKNYPLLGFAGISRLSVKSDLASLVNMVSGLASMIGMYGMFGIIILSYYLRRSSIFIAQIYNSKTLFSLAIIMIIGLVSFHIHTMTILFTFMFYSLFTRKAIVHGKKKILKRTLRTKKIPLVE